MHRCICINFLCTECSAVIYLHPCSHSLSTLLVLHIHSSQWLCSSALPTLWLPVFHGSTDVAPDTLWWLRGLCSFMLPTSCSSRSFAAPSVQVLWLPELCCSTGVILELPEALLLHWCVCWLPELCSSIGAPVVTGRVHWLPGLCTDIRLTSAHNSILATDSILAALGIHNSILTTNSILAALGSILAF